MKMKMRLFALISLLCIPATANSQDLLQIDANIRASAKERGVTPIPTLPGCWSLLCDWAVKPTSEELIVQVCTLERKGYVDLWIRLYEESGAKAAGLPKWISQRTLFLSELEPSFAGKPYELSQYYVQNCKEGILASLQNDMFLDAVIESAAQQK